MTVTPLGRTMVPAIHQALRRGVEEGVFPGGAAAVFLQGRLVHLSSTGDAQTVPERVAMADEARFDLASLTKVLATTASIAMLCARRQLGLDDRLVRFWPEFGRGRKQALTVRSLLSHSSGLPAWKPFFLDVAADPGARALFADPRPAAASFTAACRRGRAMMLEAVCATPLEREPGEQAVYSDVGFVALGHLVERVTNQSLDRYVAAEVFPALDLPSLHFRPLTAPPQSPGPLVSTGVCRPREPAPGQESLLPAPDPSRPPQPRAGEVDDDNAFAMGGVAGHAGLYGSARDVAAFGNAVLEELGGASRVGPPSLWLAFCTRDATTPRSSRALGFDTPSGDRPACGRHLSLSRTVGHTGFTGTSLFVDLDRRLSVALLTNRTHPTRANVGLTAFRPAFHDAVVEALDLA